MKFRQFEFRLFPKMKSKKKKKPKLGHADFPRDISLDKNSNFCKSGFPQFYDNLAVEANCQELFPAEIFYRQKYESMNFVSCHNAFYSCSDLKKSSLPELEINVSGSTCSCDNCACATDTLPSMTRSCTLAGFHCGSPLGTPNTIQRTRTRIKTNPWLPSPRATPSPSPTDNQQPCAPWSKGDNWSDIQITRPSDLPLTTKHSIPDSSGHSVVMMNKDTATTDGCYSRINIALLDDGVTTYKLNETCEGLDELSRPNLEDCEKGIDECVASEYSHSSSPVVEFLSSVKYKINFDYENTADDLLEASSISRHDSFNYGQSYPDHVFGHKEKGVDKNDLSHVTYCRESSGHSLLSPDAENIDVTFEDTCTNMQESIDTGYASVSRDSDCLSSDEADDEMSGEFEDSGQTNEAIDSNKIHKRYDETLNDVTDIGGGFNELELNFNAVEKDVSIFEYDGKSDVEQISDLEWDNEPITQTLLIDFPMSEKVPRCAIDEFTDRNNLLVSTQENKLQYQQIRDYGSVKYRKNHVKLADDVCVCRHRRSRSLVDIELSLEDKVTLLREEKTFVQRKVREAILEDRIRDHQMKIFRLLSGDQRKKLIMKTLYDLKTRLEDQSARLQASYCTVLSLKRMFSERRTSQVSVEYDQQVIQTDVVAK